MVSPEIMTQPVPKHRCDPVYLAEEDADLFTFLEIPRNACLSRLREHSCLKLTGTWPLIVPRMDRTSMGNHAIR